jgi:hypothetical protein
LAGAAFFLAATFLTGFLASVFSVLFNLTVPERPLKIKLLVQLCQVYTS